ncbi:META domain-containing protein [Corynebacterium oculi]|uniref:META domain protein n=1 Tax=Corynebacterium oculi TaxID=1544416 RepID=A0A0N8VZA1_9CORY|nr:META domain-containing protein [Corynebacterium oculi]KQB83322.1 META domain protein [Corynebacterium oculi]
MSLRYSLATASALILAGAATAGAAESTPLTGTEWGYSYGAFFTLHDDGTIGGNDGCNPFGGNATIDGDTLTVDGLFSTMRFCGEGYDLTDILHGEHTVRVESDTLTLTDAQGTAWSFSARK